MSDQRHGLTVMEFCGIDRVGKLRALSMIRSGELPALNVAPPLARPRYVILPEHLAVFERGHQASSPPPPRRRRMRTYAVDYFPD
jgi:hypothetical protein